MESCGRVGKMSDEENARFWDRLYLTELFTRLPSETNQTVHRLTPKAWAEERRQAKTAKLAVTP